MRYLVAALLILPLSGCVLELLTTTAIQGELAAQNASAVMRQQQRAQDTINRTQINHAIGLYAAETGYYPANLQTLVPNFLASVPTQPDGTPYGYDPLSGTLITGPVPTITAEDREAMNALRDAIHYYGQDTGYYPAMLDQLVPNYIDRVPVTSSGQPFLYNSQDGALSHPAVSGAPRARGQSRTGSAAGGGAGLLGEVVTGIGIQQQLSNMGTSGTSGAGARGRQRIDDIQNDYNRRQQEALDEINQ